MADVTQVATDVTNAANAVSASAETVKSTIDTIATNSTTLTDGATHAVIASADTVKTTLDSIVANSSSLTDAISSLSTFMSNLAHQYGPDLVNLVYMAARIDSIQTLLFGFFALWAAIFCGKKAMVLLKQGYELSLEASKTRYHVTMSDFWQHWAGLVLTMASATSGFIAATRLLDIWVWVTLYDPLLGIVGRHLVQFL